MIGGYGLQSVRFVKNDYIVVRQQACARAAECQVAEKQAVIDHQNLRVMNAAPCGIEVALVVSWTLAAQAVAILALYLFPNGPQRLERHVTQAAVVRRLG